MAITGAVAAVVIGAGSAGYQAKRGHDQKVQANHQQDENEAAQLALDSRLEAKKKLAEEQATVNQQYKQQRALRMGLLGRQGTFRTSAQGYQPFVPSGSVGGNAKLGAA